MLFTGHNQHIPSQIPFDTHTNRIIWYSERGDILAPSAATTIEISTVTAIHAPQDSFLLVIHSAKTHTSLVFLEAVDRHQFCSLVFIANPSITLQFASPANVNVWALCGKSFSIRRRKLTCKNCNAFVCASCCSKKVKLESDQWEKVCDRCFVQIKNLRVNDKVQDLHFVNEASAEMEAEGVDNVECSSKTDAYGFVIDETKEASQQVSQQEWTNRRVEAWNKYLLENPSLDNAKNLKQMVRAGIPPKLRGAIWQELSGSQIYRSIYPGDYYKQLVERGEYLSEIDSVIQQIVKDLKRTVPSHAFFDEKGGLIRLRRVLVAYSIRNP